MPQLLILQPLLWVVPLITTSSRPRLSSAFRFKRRQGAAGAGNSPSVSEGVAEGRGSNMSVKIPCAWLAARGDVLSSLRSRRMGSLRELYYVTQKSRKSQKITRCARKWARFARRGGRVTDGGVDYLRRKTILPLAYFRDFP